MEALQQALSGHPLLLPEVVEELRAEGALAKLIKQGIKATNYTLVLCALSRAELQAPPPNGPGLSLGDAVTLKVAFPSSGAAAASGSGGGGGGGAGGSGGGGAPEVSADNSEPYVARLMDQLKNEPTWQELHQLLNAPLKAPLPVMPYKYRQLTATPFPGVVSLHTVPSAQVLCQHVTSVMNADFTNFSTEDQVHHPMDTLILDTFKLLEKGPYRLGFLHSRNASDTRSLSTLERKRADFLLWVANALLFKGEEKALQAEQPTAVFELTQKMTDTWDPSVYGDCTFQLGYASGGSLIEFYSLRSHVVEKVAGPFDLIDPRQRFDALCVVCNIHRVLHKLSMNLPKIAWPLGGTLERRDASGAVCGQLTWFAGHVRKEVLNFTADGSGYASLDVLQAVYAVATSCPSLIHAKTTPRLHGSTYVVDLEPVGQPCSAAPASESGVKAAVRGVLEALKTLHQAGLVHRDVRWSNVIFIKQGKRYVLIDLELACKADLHCSRLFRYWVAPGGGDVLQDGCFTPRSDLHMVALHLLSELSFPLTLEGEDFKTKLCDGTLSTADDALGHSWLSCQ